MLNLIFCWGSEKVTEVDFYLQNVERFGLSTCLKEEDFSKLIKNLRSSLFSCGEYSFGFEFGL
jgi:hypothetical protein